MSNLSISARLGKSPFGPGFRIGFLALISFLSAVDFAHGLALNLTESLNAKNVSRRPNPPEPQYYKILHSNMGLDFLEFGDEVERIAAEAMIEVAYGEMLDAAMRYGLNTPVMNGRFDTVSNRIKLSVGSANAMDNPIFTYQVLRDLILGLRRFFYIDEREHFWDTHFAIQVNAQGPNRPTVASAYWGSLDGMAIT